MQCITEMVQHLKNRGVWGNVASVLPNHPRLMVLHGSVGMGKTFLLERCASWGSHSWPACLCARLLLLTTRGRRRRRTQGTEPRWIVTQHDPRLFRPADRGCSGLLATLWPLWGCAGMCGCVWGVGCVWGGGGGGCGVCVGECRCVCV